MFTDSPEPQPISAADRARTTIIPLVGLVVVIALFAPALSAATGSVAVDVGDRTAVNESVTVDYNGSIDVDTRADGYGESINATTADGTPLNATDDYRWNSEIGAVEFVDSGATTAGETVFVEYDAYSAPENSQRSLAFLSPLTSFLPWILVFVAGIGALKGWSG